MSYDPNEAKSIFLQAAELPSSADRADFLERACIGRPELRARVESLLKTALDPDSLLDQPVAEFVATRMMRAAPNSDEDQLLGSSTQVHLSADDLSLDFLEPCAAPGRLGRLGLYEILEVIGRGGMGIVLRAMDSKLNRVVAIKVLAPELASQPQARKRFLREAQAAAAVSHDHVVTIHAVDDEHKVPFLVMECIVGQSLQQKIDKAGALGVKEILRIGMQIAAGLAAAHQQGLVHRDIKPANILLENGVERVKITDFGLARTTDDVGITHSGQIAGTPQYMSPEQAQGQPVDHRSDLFSLGSVLYTLCTGRPAFRAESAVAVLRRVCDDAPRPICEINPEIPDWLVAIIEKLMAKSPESRFQTAREVAEVLSGFLAHLQQPQFSPPPTFVRLNEPKKLARPAWYPVATSCLWLGHLVCLVLFLSPYLRTSHDEKSQFFFSIGSPSPWFVYDVIPGESFHQHLVPFSFSVMAAITGWMLYGLLWQMERLIGQTGRAKKYFVTVAMLWMALALADIGAGNWAAKMFVADSMTRPRTTMKTEAIARSTSANSSSTTQLGWQPLFNEHDLSGWQKMLEAPGEWKVENGVLTGRGPSSFLFTDRGDYRDFHLRAEVRINAAGDSGIIFRSPFELVRYPRSFGVQGYEAQIQAGDKSNMLTGSLAVVHRNHNWRLVTPTTESLTTPEQWFTLEIVARDNHVVVKVNGQTTADYTDPDRNLATGHIVLQQSTPQTIVQFRKIEIKELAPESTQPSLAVAPFDAEQARTHQEAWAKHLGVSVEQTNSVGMTLRLIPPGRFQMGSTPEELAQLKQELEQRGASDFEKFVAQSSGPRHLVEISRPFYMGQHEVTVSQFQQFVDETAYQPSAERAGNARFTWKQFIADTDTTKQPVCGVSWDDAKAFCEWLTVKSSSDQNPGTYNLPSEAQWEYACRSGSQSLWSFGDDPTALAEHAIVGQKGMPQPAQVGQKQTNPFGLFDMHGNVDEWCLDWHNAGFYAHSSLVDPVFSETPQQAASGRVARGGAWNADNWWSRSATRAYDFPTAPTYPKGFRVILSLHPKADQDTPRATTR